MVRVVGRALVSLLPAPSPGRVPSACRCPSRPPVKPGAGQGALPPSRPPPEPPGLAGSPGCDVAATKPLLAYVLRGLHPSQTLAGYRELRTGSCLPAPTLSPPPKKCSLPQRPCGDPSQPVSREPGPQHCHVRRQLRSPAQAARLSPGQGSRCGNWLCPVLRMEMDFFPSPPP